VHLDLEKRTVAFRRRVDEVPVAHRCPRQAVFFRLDLTMTYSRAVIYYYIENIRRARDLRLNKPGGQSVDAD
jgi:hypothetical protein